jgi:hypothetical protein
VVYGRALPFQPALSSFAPEVACAPGGASYVATNDGYEVVVGRLNPDAGALVWQRRITVASPQSSASQLALEALTADDQGVGLIARWKEETDGCGEAQRAVLLRLSDGGALTARRAMRIVPRSEDCVGLASFSLAPRGDGGFTGTGSFFDSGFGRRSVLFELDSDMKLVLVEEPDGGIDLEALATAGPTFFTGIGHLGSTPLGWRPATAFEPVEVDVAVSSAEPAALLEMAREPQLSFDLEGEWSELGTVFDAVDPARRDFVTGRR